MKKYEAPFMEKVEFVPQDNMTVSGGTTVTTEETLPPDEF